jgi:hypothetical protein
MHAVHAPYPTNVNVTAVRVALSWRTSTLPRAPAYAPVPPVTAHVLDGLVWLRRPAICSVPPASSACAVQSSPRGSVPR